MRKRRPITKVIKQEKPARTAAHEGKPAFILTADTHIRDIPPKCRKDNYIETVFKKLGFLKQAAIKHDIPILHAGDIGDKSFFVKREGEKDNSVGWTAEVYNRFVDMFTEETTMDLHELLIFCCAGNHDLPGHDINNLKRSVFYSMMRSGAIHLIKKELYDINYCDVYGCSWDCEIPKPLRLDNKNILVIHKMIINELPFWPGQEAPKAVDILKENPGYDLIVSGDNHNTFTAEYNGRLLVNCGSMMRSTTKQFDHKPCFFLYYPESNTVEKVFYPIDPPEEVISLEHIDKKNMNNKRTEKYTNLVNNSDISNLLTFKENSEIFISKNKSISPNVIKYIRGFVNHEQPNQSNQSIS